MKKHSAFIVSVISASLCFALLAAYFVFDLKTFHVDETAIKIFFAGLICLLAACVSRLKIGEIIEIENLQKEVEEIKEFVLKGKLIRTHRGESFFVDGLGRQYAVPDEATADFLESSRGGVILKSDQEAELKGYPHRGTLDSVLRCRVIKSSKGDLFAVLNSQKYYISSWSYIFDWGRKDTEIEAVDDSAIKALPRGR